MDGQTKTTIPAMPKEQHGRTFQEIVVEYLPYNTYPYKGKPYFSIKYTENGQEFIGYGTFKPEVLSEYLKEYFMPSAQPEPLTDAEQRIFLAAMSREKEVCKEVDCQFSDAREPYEDTLVRVCGEIKRKVKAALWTN